MGLIGGGHHGMADTNMLVSPYWKPGTGVHTKDPDSVTLINYKTLDPLALPTGVPFIFSWILSF
jgi:hypothetical protein